MVDIQTILLAILIAVIYMLVTGGEKNMIDKEEYKRELIRMWDSLRTKNIGLNYCEGVSCKDCPLLAFGGCKSAIDSLDIYKAVKEWSDEHPNEEE